MATATASLATAPAKKPRKRRIVVTDELIEKVRSLTGTVRWQTDIAAQLGMNRATVGAIQRRLGMSPRRALKAKPEKIFVTRAMKEMASVRSLTVGAYVAQLADADRAEHRLKTFGAKERPTPAGKNESPINAPSEAWRRKVNAVQVQRILFLLSKSGEELSDRIVAERIGCSVSTVRRIADQHNPKTPIARRSTRHGVAWGEQGALGHP
jgi:hypothetical protein